MRILWSFLVAVSAACSEPSDPAPSLEEVRRAPGTAIPRIEVGEGLFDGRQMCAGCHGSGDAPRWAFDADAVLAVHELRRSAYDHSGMYQAERRLTLRADGTATRDMEVDGWFEGEQRLGSFTDTESSSTRAELRADEWSAFAETVASSGLFRYVGECGTGMAFDAESAVIEVEWRDRPATQLRSDHVWHESDHPSLVAVFEAILAVESKLKWSDVP